jgi:hypothetical protein
MITSANKPKLNIEEKNNDYVLKILNSPSNQSLVKKTNSSFSFEDDKAE